MTGHRHGAQTLLAECALPPLDFRDADSIRLRIELTRPPVWRGTADARSAVVMTVVRRLGVTGIACAPTSRRARSGQALSRTSSVVPLGEGSRVRLWLLVSVLILGFAASGAASEDLVWLECTGTESVSSSEVNRTNPVVVTFVFDQSNLYRYSEKDRNLSVIDGVVSVTLDRIAWQSSTSHGTGSINRRTMEYYSTMKRGPRRDTVVTQSGQCRLIPPRPLEPSKF